MLFNRPIEGDTGPISYIETEGLDGKLINPGEWSDEEFEYAQAGSDNPQIEPARVLTLELLGERERAVIAAARTLAAAGYAERGDYLIEMRSAVLALDRASTT